MKQSIPPKDKSLVKIDYEQLKRKIGRKPELYRGTLQGFFERNILQSMVNGEEPSYFGYYDQNTGDRLTFFDWTPYVAEGYIERLLVNDRHTHEAFYSGQDPFTIHGIILKLDSEKYRDRLYFSKQGEGVVVIGNILLRDLEIIYSKKRDSLVNERINFFTNRNGKTPTKEMIRRWEKTQKEFPQKYGFLEEDIFSALKKNPDRIESICDYVFGMRHYPHPEEQKRIIMQGLQVLEAKLN